MKEVVDERRRQDQEAEASLFALCLLIPEQPFRKALSALKAQGNSLDLCDPGWVDDLAKRFDVTPAMLTLRMVDLGLVCV